MQQVLSWIEINQGHCSCVACTIIIQLAEHFTSLPFASICLFPPYLCFSRGRLESTLAASPSSGEPGEVGDGGECLLGLADSERGESFRVGKEGVGGVRGDSLRIGEDGKEGDEEEGGEEDTSVLWFQFFCLRVCCCCCRPEVELFSLVGEQSTASN